MIFVAAVGTPATEEQQKPLVMLVKCCVPPKNYPCVAAYEVLTDPKKRDIFDR